MRCAAGKSILNAVAIGKLRLYRRTDTQTAATAAHAPEGELDRFHAALEEAKEQLGALYEKALEEAGEDAAEIFEIHQMMLEDEDYVEAIEDAIGGGNSAVQAVQAAGASFAETFAQMDDEYMRARAADIEDISRRLTDILSGVQQGFELGGEPVILVADDLTPSETIQLDKSKLLGFITRRGSASSHTAILARTMSLPALIGVDFEEDWDGRLAVLDGYSGQVFVDPEPELLEKMEAKRQEDLQRLQLLQELKGVPTVTLDGREVKLYANIGSVADVELANQNDAGGVGLFRSEFLYLDRPSLPTEEEQFDIYKQVVQGMKGKKVIIRTLDIGADKQAACFHLDKEENPALGYRAIRICLTQQDVFKTQLRAILRASAFGTVSVMFPMIASLWELQEAKALLAQCREELTAQGVPLGAVEVGVMVETPAAALIADDLAQEVDFFSLGTNDLTQYTLAADRQNAKLEPFVDTHHPAVLRLIRLTVEAGHRHGCWVGICGELGADLTLTDTFLRMGVDELSVSPSAVLPVRQKVRSLDLSQVMA